MLEVRSHYRKEHHNKSVNSIDVCILTFKVHALLQGICHLQVLLLAECNYRGANAEGSGHVHNVE